jgi:hypothetical protein
LPPQGWPAALVIWILLTTFTGCAVQSQIRRVFEYGPPGKGQSELEFDVAQCQRASGIGPGYYNDAFITCMLYRGNTVDVLYLDGQQSRLQPLAAWNPPPQPQFIAPLHTQVPATQVIPDFTPETPEAIRPVAPAPLPVAVPAPTRASPSPDSTGLTRADVDAIRDLVVAVYKAYRACSTKDDKKTCMLPRVGFDMLEHAGPLACAHPKAVTSLLSGERAKIAFELAGCPDAMQ